MKRALLALLLAGIVSACGTDASSPASSAVTPAPTASPSVSAGSPSAAPTESSATGISVPEPGRPFDAATLLDAMRTSRRPGGVPDQLETDLIAGAVADAIWTYGGEPWTTLAIGGRCGEEDCALEVAGTRPASAGEDLWVFEIEPITGTVDVASTELGALPDALVEQLDVLARSIHGPSAFEGMALASVRWLPPPDDGQFELSYRSGGEEGSCRADFTIDAVNGLGVAESSEAC
ncbi:MAG: hypothetical protein ACRDGD_03850 [Candidatus Limnocylindria bacterium]